MKWPAVVSCLLFFVSSAAAQLTLPTPTPPTLPSPTPIPSIQSPTPTPTPQQPAANPGEFIPVVITYGDGSQTRAQITRGIMHPVGIPLNQPVTVTLFLGSGIPGTVVRIGLYDGGQVLPAVPLPSPPPVGVSPVSDTMPLITVAADQTVRFNFQSGQLLGPYRTLVTVAGNQYLLQFYAVRPRPTSGLPPVPSPSPTPPIVPSTPPPNRPPP